MALAEVFEALAGPDAPVEFTAYDGSHAGQAGSPVKITVRSPAAVAYLAQAPGELGLARAYVAGQLDVEGDMYEALSRMTKAQSSSLTLAEKLRLLQALGGPKLLLHRMPPPPQEVTQTRRWLTGPLHSKTRDAKAISHHYDVSNRFYELLLGPSMVYSCAYFADPGEALETAQERKLELICQKLRLEPGERLLDVGCGWGSLLLHAATHHGVRALGVTLSEAQARYARERIRLAGLEGRVEVRVADYREVRDGPFDKIASVGMYEHVGGDELVRYAATIRGLLRPGGLFLNHGIARLHSDPPASDTLVSRYVFPDGEMRPVTDVMAAIQQAELEVRDVESLREHYTLTLRGWAANLAAHRDEAIAEVGAERERVWRLYIPGSALAFEDGDITVYQVLAARSGAPHRLPLTRRTA
jgi:cyclopropane-fatty-acyl-phospholipid synthase